MYFNIKLNEIDMIVKKIKRGKNQIEKMCHKFAKKLIIDNNIIHLKKTLSQYQQQQI